MPIPYWNWERGGSSGTPLCALVRVIRIPFFPTSQTDTKWQSEDETIYFCINENSPDIGEVIIKGEKVEFVVRGGSSEGGIICIYNTSILEDETLADQLYEIWDINIKSKKKFVATIKETKFSPDRVGKKITFHRIDEK